MESSILKIVGQIAGIGGLALGVLLLIFLDIIRKNIFPTLTMDQAFKLIRLIVIFAFLIAVLGLLAWIYTLKPISPSSNNTSIQIEPGEKPLVVGTGDTPIKIELVPPKTGREIPIEQMPDGYEVWSKGTPLEITDIYYDQQKKNLDVKVRNNSQESTIVEAIKLRIEYEYRRGGPLGASGTHEANIPKKDIETAKANKVPLFFEKGFNVSYVIAPKGADRYLFKFNLNKDDLYYPESRDKGEYKLFITFFYNKGQRSGEFVSLDELLNKT